MNILGLPGVNPATKKWMQELLIGLSGDSIDSKIQEYRHWSDNSDVDIDYEANCLKESSADLVIAKSLGTFVSTYAFDVYNFRPRKAVFIGSPIRRHSSGNYELLSKFVETVPTHFIQQTSDFNGSYSELSNIVQDLPNATITEVPGEDHIYSNFDELQKIIHPMVTDDA
jgi:hypothetical protein